MDEGMYRQSREQSPGVLTTVIVLHVAVIAALLHYQPKLDSAMADVIFVRMIAPPRPLPSAPPPESSQPKVKPVKNVQKTIATPTPLDTTSPAAISLAPAAPAPAPAEPAAVVASVPPAPPASMAPLVLPRFNAAYLQNPAPIYPLLSRRVGEQGKVLLRVVVRPDGMPEQIELRRSSGSQRLDQAAVEAVRKWRFVPARQGETPVTAAVIVPIVFPLEG